jgi:hypothetical protein
LIPLKKHIGITIDLQYRNQKVTETETKRDDIQPIYRDGLIFEIGITGLIF